MSPWKMPNHDWHPRFPRVSGDEPEGVRALPTALMFSPRERG